MRASTSSARADGGLAALSLLALAPSLTPLTLRLPPLALSLSKGALGAGVVLALAGCSAPSSQAEPAHRATLVECAVGGAATFALDCQVERSEQDGAPILVVRHPDGGFRRFVVIGGGTRLATADGAEAAEVTPRDDGIEVAVGTDRYRFPLAMTGDDPR